MNLIRVIAAFFLSIISIILTLPLILAGLIISAISLGTKIMHDIWRYFRPRPVPWQNLIEYEPIVGWKPRPNLNTYAKTDDVFHLTTDTQGWRGRTSLKESKIVVFGDSFAFGYGMDDKRFFGGINKEFPIKTIGANGYNMVQEYLWMERLSPHLSGKLVTWFIYYGNDLYENLQPHLEKYRMPFLKMNGSDWHIVTQHVKPIKWPTYSRRNYYKKLAEICSPGDLSKRAFSACNYLITRGKELCQRVNATLIIIGLPDISQFDKDKIQQLKDASPHPQYFDPELPDKRLKQICEELNIPFFTLKDYLKKEDFKEFDVHWNENGHHKVADLLITIYSELMVSAELPSSLKNQFSEI